MDRGAAKENISPIEDKELKKRCLQRSGPRKTVYWVERQPQVGTTAEAGPLWRVGVKYKGEWKADMKHGFGVMQYSNCDVYKGKFALGRRDGEGALWTVRDGKLQRGYTGMWHAGQREGKGMASYPDGTHYEGYWHNNQREGFGRLIYPGGDVYFGEWRGDVRNGYGILVYKNGDNYEGMWLCDRKEGHGSYYHAKRSALFVGEWADDTPAAGVYADVEGKALRGSPLPPLGLETPLEVVEAALQEVRNERAVARMRLLPLDALFDDEDLEKLRALFGQMAPGRAGLIEATSAILGADGPSCTSELCVQAGFDADQPAFDAFCRLAFLLLQAADR